MRILVAVGAPALGCGFRGAIELHRAGRAEPAPPAAPARNRNEAAILAPPEEFVPPELSGQLPRGLGPVLA